MKLHIPIIVGTARDKRKSIYPAKYLLQLLENYNVGITTELVDVRDYVSTITIPSWEPNEHTKKWATIVKKSDGFIFVVPEYNHGYPGELKIFLDGVYKEYNRKPAVACGVSNGHLGGARGVDHITHVLSSLGMCALSKSGHTVYFGNIETLFDTEGNITDDAYSDRVKKMFDELTWYAKALKQSRDEK